MAFISQHCRTPVTLLEPLLLDVKILDMSLSLVWDNLSGDMVDFLLAAAEHTKAAPVGLHVSDTILKNSGTLLSHLIAQFSDIN